MFPNQPLRLASRISSIEFRDTVRSMREAQHSRPPVVGAEACSRVRPCISS